MAGITGQGDTFDLPNFVGELFQVGRNDFPFLSAIGGLTGGKQANAKEFEWQYWDLRSPANRYNLEGADAPTAKERVRANASNVLQIVQEAVEVSYTKQAAIGQLGDPNVAGSNPITNEFDWQIQQELVQIARDLNYSFINGAYAKPADNATERQTRGILAAIATNVVTPDPTVSAGADLTGEADTELFTTGSAHGLTVGDLVQIDTLIGGTGLTADTNYWVRSVPSTTTFTLSATRGGAILAYSTDVTTGSSITSYPRVTADYLGDAMQSAFVNGGLALGETRTAIVGAHQKRRLTQALITDASYEERSRTVGGVNVSVIETDFGPLNIMLDITVPDDTIILASMEDITPVFLLIPGKGFLFVEPLARVGSAERAQIYGEVGLEYGNEQKHAKLTGLG